MKTDITELMTRIEHLKAIRKVEATVTVCQCILNDIRKSFIIQLNHKAIKIVKEKFDIPQHITGDDIKTRISRTSISELFSGTVSRGYIDSFKNFNKAFLSIYKANSIHPNMRYMMTK